MTDENRYGEYECDAPGCPAVFMDAEVRDRHYRRVHGNEDTSAGDRRQRNSKEDSEAERWKAIRARLASDRE